MSQRTRTLTERMAGQVSAYLQELVDIERAKGNDVSCGVFDNSGTYTRQISSDDVSVRTIQDISINDNLYAAVRTGVEMRVYSGKMPFEVTSEISGRQSQMYLDELTDYLDTNQMSYQQMKQTSATQKVAPGKEDIVTPAGPGDDKFADIRAKAEEYHVGEFNGRLVGVGRRLIRTRDNVQDAFVSVAIPWDDAKNGLGYIDIPKDVFDAANTPEDMKKRNSYHIPLEKEAYGMWYVDKHTELAIKPTIPVDVIYKAYEVNRIEYRKNKESDMVRQTEEMTKPVEQQGADVQQNVSTEEVESTAAIPVEVSVPTEQTITEPKQRDVPNIVNEVPDFGEELEFA